MDVTPDRLRALNQMMQIVPHSGFLGMRLTKVDAKVVTTELDYREDLIGDPDSGALHGGVITGMLDASCGLAVMVALDKLTRIATLDLRVDYFKPSTPGATLYSRCDCYKMTQQVAFVQGLAYELTEDGQENQLARATGTFMVIQSRSGVEG